MLSLVLDQTSNCHGASSQIHSGSTLTANSYDSEANITKQSNKFKPLQSKCIILG